ncbi:MAG: hypothetical protein Q8M51_05960 [Polaromonas sp.]|uniref:hypothetical protein n=1 Tax=Polaromonas sp. TaxID=1869339 RepID=UPI0027308316|nr:hypothetical protein [Polaromonas sp.]MDP1742671.1 hypothetical protein [Polaromonas sp.]MDP3355391.1 hypothetical protein [Polaromonas sp.]
MQTAWLPFTTRLTSRLLWLGLCATLHGCAALSGLSTDEQLLQADRDRALAQGEFRKSEINHQNQTPTP